MEVVLGVTMYRPGYRVSLATVTVPDQIFSTPSSIIAPGSARVMETVKLVDVGAGDAATVYVPSHPEGLNPLNVTNDPTESGVAVE